MIIPARCAYFRVYLFLMLRYQAKEVIMRTLFAFPASSLILAAVLFLSPSPARALPNFTEGMWEMKGEVRFQGDMKIEGKTIHMKPVNLHYSKCLTKKDMVPHKQEKNQSCTKVSEKTSGNTVTWVIKCTEPNGMVVESTGSATFSSSTVDSKWLSVMTNAKGEKIKATATMKGRRTGPCKE
jgi:hypothetical protein